MLGHESRVSSGRGVGATSGLGAIYEWSGNREVGSGRMEIIDTSPASMVRIELEFSEPFATTNMVEFSLDRVDDYTEVTWRTEGPMPYLSKLFSVFVIGLCFNRISKAGTHSGAH